MLRRCSTLHLIPIRRCYASTLSRKPQINSSRITRQEEVKIRRRRIGKAERDERMDITAALTPVRTYMGGFTRPTALRASNWFTGGAYQTGGKVYEQPSPFAYEPHTVFLLESRYDVRYGIGRADHVEHVVGICRAEDFEEVVKLYNSKSAPVSSFQAMDNARWPWLPQKQVRTIKWWNKDGELREVSLDTAIPNSSPQVTVSPNSANATVPKEHWVRPGDSIPFSEKDVERKDVQTNAVKHRVSEENLDNILVELRSREGKVPFEVELNDGTVEHPSGFVPPTAADKFGDRSSVGSNAPSSASYRSRRSSLIEETHSEAVPGIEQWKAIKEREIEEGTLMPHLTEGILQGGVSAAMKQRDEKIPTEVYGVNEGGEMQPMQHPSGFIPPTPKMARGEHEARTATVSAPHAEHLPVPDDVKELRHRYLRHISKEPFWRPLLAITVSTRPLANTIARLSRGQSRGVPFYASVPEVDRKSKTTFGSRLRNLRLNRMQNIVVDLSKALAGDRGGLVGIRFNEKQKGRGIDGEGLAEPIPWERRVIGIGVGEWYPRADEVKEILKEMEKDIPRPAGQKQSPFIVYSMNEWGKPARGEDVEFPWPKMINVDPRLEEAKKVLKSIKELERILDVDARDFSPSQIRVVTPKMSANESIIDVVSNPDVPVAVLSPSDSLPVGFDSQNSGILEGAQARGALKERVDRIYGRHGEAIAELLASRSNQVTYPYSWAEEATSEVQEDEDIQVEEEEGGGSDAKHQKQQQ